MNEEIMFKWENLKSLFDNKVFYRDIETGELLLDLDNLNEYDPSMYTNFFEETEEVLHLLKKNLKSLRIKNYAIDYSIFKIHKLRGEIPISRIRQNNCNKICKIKGIIKRISKPISRTKVIEFECTDCGSFISIPQNKKNIIIPSSCPCTNRNPRRFIERDKIKEDIQEIILEEFLEETPGRQPQQIRIYSEGDLTEPDFTGRLQPGKRIEVIGIVKEVPPFMKKSDIEENINDFMVNAIEINTLDEEEELKVTEEDILKIKELSKENPLEKLSNSLAPSIFGNSEIKKAIVLQLVKGVKKKRPDGTFTRGDIHILLSGDPGQAKTLTLKATSLRSPNSRYVSGTGSSGVGLTALLDRDELLGTFTLQAGVLVLCNNSIVLLDELDKMKKEQLSNLLEPMETQTVSVNRGGISATLPAQTSVLAGANPIKGKFNIKQPLSPQIDLPSPLLNRFDLIFIMVDRVNEENDRRAIRHLFKIHSQELNQKEEIPISLFKKYIYYARKLNPHI